MSTLPVTLSRVRLLGALASVLVLGTTAACAGAPPALTPQEEPCTSMACFDGLRVALTPASGRWAPGAYVLTITTPEGRTVCEGALPLAACEGGPSLRCEGPRVLVTEEGCALPADEQGFPSIEILSQPGSLEVDVARDGTTIAQGAFTPSYRSVSPNGPNCGPTCRQASEALTW
jgi:hypothetical protein